MGNYEMKIDVRRDCFFGGLLYIFMLFLIKLDINLLLK